MVGGDKMKAKTRINPKTFKTEYKIRYLWKDSEGKRKDSETGWFPTEAAALKNATILKLQKEANAKDGREVKNNKLLSTVYDEWLETMKRKANRETTENTTSDVSRYQKARTIRKYYMPREIANTKARDINVITFRKWIEYLNTCKQAEPTGKSKGKELAGSSVREFRKALTQFNRYLGGQGYYLDNELEISIDNMLSRVQLKSKKIGRRTRYCPTIYDVRKILDHYEANMIEDFQQFYWYTLFMVLFYSGMRPEEVIGLVWKHVHFDVARPYIDLVNAISERESKENVSKRMEAGIYHMKNNNSEREIPMLEYYYEVFESYRYRFKEEFSPDNMGECYVFPNIKAKNKAERLTDYQKQKNILRELDRVCEIEGIPKTDVQMLRHACATWLVMDEDHGGMGYEESRARDYFGHTSDAMLRDVYAKLDKRQRASRTSETFRGITKKHAHARVPEEIQKSKEINEKVRNPEANREDKFDSIYNRIQGEILEAYHSNRDYHYLLKDFPYVMLIIQERLMHGVDIRNRINLIYKQTSMDEVWFDEVKETMKRIHAEQDEQEDEEVVDEKIQ